MEGDPVRGCGALFISWGSACGGRRVPVYKAGEKIKEMFRWESIRTTQYNINTLVDDTIYIIILEFVVICSSALFPAATW